MSVQVGFLRHGVGMYVVCLDCEKHKINPEQTPIFAENLRPYRQPCVFCGKELIERHAGVVLFSGRP